MFFRYADKWTMTFMVSRKIPTLDRGIVCETGRKITRDAIPDAVGILRDTKRVRY